MTEAGSNDRRGIYNIEYFSGSQASIYIGDVLVDEVTSINYQVSQSRTPLYGYADQLFRDVSKGVVLVQGSFSVNFKEAGYLWLVLNRYRELVRNQPSLMAQVGQPGFAGSTGDPLVDANIEKLVNGELGTADRNAMLQDALADMNDPATDVAETNATIVSALASPGAGDLLGFSSARRSLGNTTGAESVFEAFENRIWGEASVGLDRNQNLESEDRRADDPDLNPFDIFVTFGDYGGSDHHNHTVQKITNVHILGTSKQIVIDGQPIQEVYSFIARNVV
jgi:hypothetical protein